MIDKSQWLAIGLLSGFAYILGKDRESFEAEEFYKCKNCDYNVELEVEAVFEGGLCSNCLVKEGFQKEYGTHGKWMKNGEYAKKIKGATYEDYDAESFEAKERWYLSDPCYAIPEDRWGEFVGKLPNNLKNKKVDVKWEVDGKEYIVEVWQSPGGDGVWSFPSLNCDFGVDAGLLAVIPEKVAMEGKRPFGGKWFNKKPTLFTDEKKYVVKINNKRNKNVDNRYNPFDAESFGAAYTPEQRLDDYTPEQLTTSSAVTGDFFEDSLKYSYGGIQGAEELPQQETEIVYAEGFPALQNAEAGMVVNNIENYYIKKKEKFMTILVDEPTLFRMAHDLPLFVELFPSEYAGYTNIKFNYIENPDMEQKILSYAITLQDTTEENKEESEYRAGDVRSRLFDVEFDDWAEQEMKTHGDEVSFKDWADEESESHGDEEFMDWAKHEEESHDERYEAEGGRNVSDFEMSNTDRYEIGNEIIALSSALKKAGDWDWKNVKKIGKGIKEGKYERIKKNMADIDFKTRRVLWDRHHNDFFDIFTDEQIRGLAIPWVTDKYEAEISSEKLEQMERKFHKKIDSYQEGINYTACKSCGLECKVEALEDTKGSVLYYFYSCKCGHNDIQDSSYDAESFEAKQERKPREMCVNCDRQSLAPSASRLGQNICRTCQRRFGLKSKKAESFEAQPVNISDDMIIDYLKNSHKVIRKYTAPYRFTKNGIAREFKVKETWMAKKLRELEENGLIDGSVMRRTEDSPERSYSLRNPVKIYKLAGTELNKDLMRADEEYKFISRIPKSMGIGGKTEIQKNNLEYVFKKANRPLYPREVVELYNRERSTGKQSNFKKGGLSTGKISRLIKSEPKKYYVSRSGLIHYVGESSMKDYIRNLPAKYYAEENMRLVISEEDILKYLQNSHEYIKRYNAPWKFTSYGMAKKFDFAPSSMRNTLLKMERNGLLKSVLKTVEDSPVPMYRKTKIYYLADKRLIN